MPGSWTAYLPRAGHIKLFIALPWGDYPVYSTSCLPTYQNNWNTVIIILFLIRFACLLNVYSVWVHLPQKVVPFNYDRSNMFLTPRRALSRLYHGHLPKWLVGPYYNALVLLWGTQQIWWRIDSLLTIWSNENQYHIFLKSAEFVRGWHLTEVAGINGGGWDRLAPSVMREWNKHLSVSLVKTLQWLH